MELKRLLTNICTKDLEKSKQFYSTLFDFEVAYDSDWFIQLVSRESGLEIGLISEEHEIVPADARGENKGSYITFVVDDVDTLYQIVQKHHYEVIEEPNVTFYGQKRLLLIAPEGTVCDVSAPV